MGGRLSEGNTWQRIGSEGGDWRRCGSEGIDGAREIEDEEGCYDPAFPRCVVTLACEARDVFGADCCHVDFFADVEGGCVVVGVWEQDET